jgi:hypothetical protein
MQILFEQTRRGRGSRLPRLWAATAMLAAGCLGGRSPLPVDQTDEELAALMEDGTLPGSMQPAPDPVPRPPRFCGGSGGPGGPFPGGGPRGGGAGGGPGGPPRDAAAVALDGGSAPPNSDGSATGPGGNDQSCASFPIGFWQFDDCNPFRTDLFDSSSQGHPAFRGVDVACVPGQQGQAVAFSTTEDQVYAPDQPDFALDDGVTLAAWVKPEKLGGVRTIFRKRDGLTSAVALIVNGQQYQFIIRLASGRFASVSAPAQAGVWTHVAATYDNTVLRLYVNGSEVGYTASAGKIARGTGPLLMGNDILQRRFHGQMDDAWFNTMAAPADTILGLTCIRRAATATVTPAVGPTVAAGTPVTFQLAITNHNDPICAPAFFQSAVSPPPGFQFDPFDSFTSVASGQTATLPVTVTSGEESEPGSHTVEFFVFSADGGGVGGVLQASANYVVAEPTGCHVSTGRELTIRDISVVDDPIRTSLDGPAGDPRRGAWTFGRMMERLSPSASAAPDVTEAMFRTSLSPQTINGFSVAPRPAMDPVVLAPWPRTADGKLDLARAPMRLLAIVNRLDLKDLARGKAGEGRMVYGVLDSGGNQMQFTAILEYLLPATSEEDVQAWTRSFHALQALPFPSEEYNAALQAITDRFTGRDAIPGAPNGSALIDIRTNEIALSRIWELREFHLSPVTGFLDPAAVALTPDTQSNGTDRLARFINANEATILTETHEMPLSFEGAPFQAGATFNGGFDFWFAPGIVNPEARHKFSLNTCNGCHGGETNTGFLHIFPRDPGQPSQLSGFLVGITVTDPVTRTQRRLSELARRRLLMEAVVCRPATP